MSSLEAFTERLLRERLPRSNCPSPLLLEAERSMGTVKSHTGNIYRKLGVKNRTEALAHSRKLKLLP
jgi:hypothetical protein